ncbi:hypothetical protein [Dyella mobilis]|uniref:Serine/threonine protein kinase n=1 Tax=Dyella mobilis TaxID=1849582 RepID=A0ABS2KEL7_9GAMM|nr:hypothetical protein [Dyella mobilis]MBM7129618.1 hypothetical protein [Dyella mobilis]GLQ98117.1 hypothetical protein GCM10007863_25370 [Dyella mobilis]
MTVELDEMKQAWQALNHRLDRQHVLDRQLFRNSLADRLRRGLRTLVWGQLALMALGVVIALWGIGFWSSHIGIWQAMACGIAMQAFGTLSIIFPARVLALVHTVDYAAPVLEIQRRLAQLRAWRVNVEARVFGVLGSIIWIPVMLMLAQYAMDRAGVNAWDQASGSLPWLVLLGAGSLLVVGLAYALICKLGQRQRLEDSFAGSSIKHAEAMLQDIAQFERE